MNTVLGLNAWGITGGNIGTSWVLTIPNDKSLNHNALALSKVK